MKKIDGYKEELKVVSDKMSELDDHLMYNFGLNRTTFLKVSGTMFKIEIEAFELSSRFNNKIGANYDIYIYSKEKIWMNIANNNLDIPEFIGEPNLENFKEYILSVYLKIIDFLLEVIPCMIDLTPENRGS